MATVKRHAGWLVPLMLTLLFVPFATRLDLAVSGYFYNGAFRSDSFLNALYHWGPLPGQITVAGAVIVYLISFVVRRWKPLRTHALYLVLTLAVGAGLIVHAALKDHWGRPRPKQVIEFGGEQPFRPFYSPNFFNQPEPSKSFPCGHCSMGFYFFALVFIGRRTKKQWLTTTGWILAFGLGGLLSYMRIAMGGHFLSDVYFSTLIMWLTAYGMDWLLYEEAA